MAEGTVLTKMGFSLGTPGGRCTARTVPLKCPGQQCITRCHHGQGQGNTCSEKYQDQGCPYHARLIKDQGSAYHDRLFSHCRTCTFPGYPCAERHSSEAVISRQKVRGLLASQSIAEARHCHVKAAVHLHADRCFFGRSSAGAVKAKESAAYAPGLQPDVKQRGRHSRRWATCS